MLKCAFGLDLLAVGESFMEGDWECDDLVGLVEKALTKQPAEEKFFYNFPNLIPKITYRISQLFFTLNSKSQCEKDISSHYDIGNDLYRLMLDRTMNYSCGYWQKNVPIDSTQPRDGLCESLEEAQMNKMLMIARKLNLKPGMRVLDIGCGWGTLAKFLAINFGMNTKLTFHFMKHFFKLDLIKQNNFSGVHVVAITISKEQHSYAKINDVDLNELGYLLVTGLSKDEAGSFEFRLQDYRDVDETFDRIVSIGMFEHVGARFV